MITWAKSKGKYVICKEGIYLSLDPYQVTLLYEVLADIISGRDTYFLKDSRKQAGAPDATSMDRKS